MHEAYQEVLRRAAKLGAENFDCSFQRFKELSTEYREPTEVGVREAITGLQGENVRLLQEFSSWSLWKRGFWSRL